MFRSRNTVRYFFLVNVIKANSINNKRVINNKFIQSPRRCHVHLKHIDVNGRFKILSLLPGNLLKI